MSPRTKKLLKIAGIGAVVVGVGIQFVPLKHVGTNPPERFKLDAPPEVEALLREACFDCHSNETRWPLYARIAPGSWLLERDVHNGRNHMNFSEWADHDEDERQTDLETCWEQVESGEMPPWFYPLPFHPGARMTPERKALLKAFFLKGAKKEEGEKGGADKKEEKALQAQAAPAGADPAEQKAPKGAAEAPKKP